jgi:hypothetical protein
MPDAQGKYNLGDFVEDLQERGFDGFSPEQLRRIVNRAYFAVAKKSRWEWEKVQGSFSLAPGSNFVEFGSPTSAFPTLKTVDRVYLTRSGTDTTGKLSVAGEADFYQNWLMVDPAQVGRQNTPSRYFAYDGKLYVIAPPSTSCEFVVHYYQQPVALLGDTDVPVTPQHLDEAIIDASRVRAHTRANEPGLAVSARSDLEEGYDDLRDQEEEDMHELQERVTPDRSWQ